MYKVEISPPPFPGLKTHCPLNWINKPQFDNISEIKECIPAPRVYAFINIIFKLMKIFKCDFVRPATEFLLTWLFINNTFLLL